MGRSFPYLIVNLPILGDTPTVPPYSAKMVRSPYFMGTFLFFAEFFKIFPSNHIKFSNISPMGIVITFGAHTVLLKSPLKMVIFTLFPP